MKNKNLVWWIVGAFLLIVILPKLPFASRFAIVTETVCAEGITNYYSLDGNFLDAKGNQDIVNHGVSFTSGKINNGIIFNGTNYIEFPSFSNLSFGYWMKNSDWTYVTGDASTLNKLQLPDGTIIDEIVIGTNVSTPFSVQPCYIKTSYENVSCEEYVLTQISNPTGCVELTGDFFPNCSYSIENKSYYKFENNQCTKNYFCSGDTMAQCSAKIQAVTTPSGNVVPIEETTPQTNIATREVFKIFGFSVTAIHLIIILLLIGLVLYFMGVFGKAK